MLTLNATAVKIMNTLTTGMEPGSARRFGERNGAFMPAFVECIGPDTFSVAHYYEQNGDLVQDPEVEFFRAPTGAWVPLSIHHGALGIRRVAVELGDNGQPSAYRPRQLRELCNFACMWLKNIREQQDINNPTA